MLEPSAVVITDNEALPFRKSAWLAKDVPVNAPLYTLPDLLAALRQVTPEMLEAGRFAASDFGTAYTRSENCFLAMLSAFERQMEREK